MGPENNIELNSSHLKELFLAWENQLKLDERYASHCRSKSCISDFRNGPVDR